MFLKNHHRKMTITLGYQLRFLLCVGLVLSPGNAWAGLGSAPPFTSISTSRPTPSEAMEAFLRGHTLTTPEARRLVTAALGETHQISAIGRTFVGDLRRHRIARRIVALTPHQLQQLERALEEGIYQISAMATRLQRQLERRTGLGIIDNEPSPQPSMQNLYTQGTNTFEGIPLFPQPREANRSVFSQGIYHGNADFMGLQLLETYGAQRAVGGHAAYIQAPAFQVHNAKNMDVTLADGKTLGLMRAIQHVLQGSLKITPMPLGEAIEYLYQIIPDNAPNAGITRSVLNQGYGAVCEELRKENPRPDEGFPLRVRLVQWVAPYMKTRTPETQRNWLSGAVAESSTAYERAASLSCVEGVQERLCITGFLATLEDVDPNLKALSLISQLNGVPDIDFIVFGGLPYLSEEMRAGIAAEYTPDAPPSREIVEGWVFSTAGGYLANNDLLQAATLFPKLPDDWLGVPAMKQKLGTLVEKFSEPDYWDVPQGFKSFQERARLKSMSDALEEGE